MWQLPEPVQWETEDDAPEPIPGAVHLSRMAPAQWPALLQQTQAERDGANFHMRVFYQMLASGDSELAMALQARALDLRSSYRIAGCAQPRLRLLALHGPGGLSENTPLDFLLEGSDVALSQLYLRLGQPLPAVLPAHDVAMVALGESQEGNAMLQALEGLLAHWPRPVLNQPHRLRACARDALWAQLHDIAGLQVPSTRRLEPGASWDGPYPVCVRPLDSHGGRGFVRLESPEQWPALAAELAGQTLYACSFIDYRSADGQYRKCRIALIEGLPYACHMAISSDWMVHYASAGMEDSATKRAEEQHFLEHFAEEFGQRHAAALRAIAERLALDYVVLDCWETQAGELLLFEADNRGWVHATDVAELFPYKQAVMQQVFTAFRAQLYKAAGRTA